MLFCTCSEQEQLSYPAMSHAELLRIHHAKGWTGVEILNAWKKGTVSQHYILVPRESELPKDLPKGTIIRTPLQRTILFSAVHGGLFCDLGCIDQTIGMCDTDYILHDSLRQRLTDHRLADMGSSVQINQERMVASRPDALFVSPFENAGYGVLESLGIPLIECADYMETSALGRAEWMKFYGLLMGREAEADSLFASVEKDYLQLCEKVKQTKDRPSLLCDLKQGSAWYVPGGNSYIGRLFTDAGANYLFDHFEDNGSVALSFEKVFAEARDADIWIIKYGRSTPYTYSTLAQDFPLNSDFSAWKNRRIYGCNTFGTAFYEEVPFHPNRLLQDMIRILHPDVLPEHQLNYYYPLSE